MGVEDDMIPRPVESGDGNPMDCGCGSSTTRMSLIEVGRNAAVYGLRHLLQHFDSRLRRGLAAPEKVALVLTNRCNCRCLMCELWHTRDVGNELPAERWIALLDELHSWTPTLRVRFVGGEVLLKPGSTTSSAGRFNSGSMSISSLTAWPFSPSATIGT